MKSNKSDVFACAKQLKCLKQHWTSIFIILATILGFGIGLLLRQLDLDKQIIQLIGFPGMLMIRAFRMIILPLLPCSIILGITSLNKSDNRKLVSYTISFFVILSLVAAILGVTLAFLLKPGERANYLNNNDIVQKVGKKGQILDSILDTLRNAVPENIIQATFMQEYTSTTSLNDTKIVNETSNKTTSTPTDYRKETLLKQETNFIGLLVVSLIVSLVMTSLGSQVAQVRSLVEEFNLIIMKIIYYLVRILPFGMFFWMCQEGLKTKSILNVMYQLGWLILTELFGLSIHQLIVLPVLYLLIIRRNPFSFLYSILPVFLTAFGTASSLATLPVTLRCMENENKINRHISRFILPLGMVVNKPGVCIDLTVTTIFLAQMEGITVNVTKAVLLCITVVMLSMASPAISGTGSPVFILTCLEMIDVESTSNISLVLAVFWITDRLSTSGNVIGDCYVAAFVAKLCHDEVSSNLTKIVIDDCKNSSNDIPRCESVIHTIKL